MAKNIIPIRLNLRQEKPLQISQTLTRGDNQSNYFHIRIMDGSRDIDYTALSGAWVIFAKADGTTVQGEANIDTSLSKITYELGTNDIAAKGITTVSICLYYGDGGRYTTQRFVFYVTDDPLDARSVESSTEYDALRNSMILLEEIEQAFRNGEYTPQLSIGDVATGETGDNAEVTITGDVSAPILNFVLPKGGKGDTGETPNIQIGDVENLPSGSSPYVTRRAGSTDEVPILDIGVVRGADGQGAGDMLKADYGGSAYGIVAKADIASTAESIQWDNIQDTPTEFTPTAHNHNDSYYTKTEIDTTIDDTISEVDTVRVIANEAKTKANAALPKTANRAFSTLQDACDFTDTTSNVADAAVEQVITNAPPGSIITLFVDKGGSMPNFSTGIIDRVKANVAGAPTTLTTGLLIINTSLNAAAAPHKLTFVSNRESPLTFECVAYFDNTLSNFKDIGAGASMDIVASDLIASASKKFTVTATTYASTTEFVMRSAGSIRVVFTLSVSPHPTAGAATIYARIYKNGTSIGEQRSVSGSSQSVTSLAFTQDFSNVKVGDKIQVYAYRTGDTARSTSIQDFKICGSPLFAAT